MKNESKNTFFLSESQKRRGEILLALNSILVYSFSLILLSE
jgi:hypothetical protein